MVEEQVPVCRAHVVMRNHGARFGARERGEDAGAVPAGRCSLHSQPDPIDARGEGASKPAVLGEERACLCIVRGAVARRERERDENLALLDLDGTALLSLGSTKR